MRGLSWVVGAVASLVLMASAVPGAAGAAAGGAATPAGLVTQPFAVTVSVWGACLRGFRGTTELVNGDAVKVVHKRGATTLATQTVTVRKSRFTYCHPIIQPGDRFTITHGADKRTITVPDLTATIDPDLDRITGVAPTSAPDLRVDWSDRVAGLVIGGDIEQPSIDPATGDWADDLSGKVDIRNGDIVHVWFTTADQDTFERLFGTPSVWAQVGSARVAGTGVTASRPSVGLRTAGGGSVRGTFTATIKPGAPSFAGVLRKKGAKVAARAGDELSISTLPARSITLGGTGLAVTKAAGGTLTATCPAGGQYAITVNGALAGGGSVGGDGQVTQHPLDLSLKPLKVGTVVVLACETPDGLGQRASLTVR
ncbi:MAG: hypothetical protein U0869_19600 [Chloroflexota bacterium]